MKCFSSIQELGKSVFYYHYSSNAYSLGCLEDFKNKNCLRLAYFEKFTGIHINNTNLELNELIEVSGILYKVSNEVRAVGYGAVYLEII